MVFEGEILINPIQSALYVLPVLSVALTDFNQTETFHWSFLFFRPHYTFTDEFNY